MYRYFKVLTVVFLSTLTLACGNHEKDKVALVDIEVAHSVKGSRHASYPGYTEAGTTTELAFMLIGTIEHVYVAEGDYVKKGQVLARIDTRDYQTQLDATQSEYNQIKAECERVIALHEEQAVSDNDYDKARSGLERISAKLKHHKAQLTDCVITAPYDGFVEKVFRHDKEAAAPGVPVVSIFSSASSDIVINIPEKEYLRRRKMTSCSAMFNSMPGRPVPLKLKNISSMANANQLYQARFVCAEPVADITPGMTVMVNIEYSNGNQSKEVLVPAGALWAEGQQAYVYLFESVDGTIVKTPVEVSQIKADGTAVVSNGLQDGDRVVASGVHHLVDEQRVMPIVSPAEVIIND